MRVLFVCLGNICRSPMAEGVFRQIATERNLGVEIDSAGTGAWHVGEPPDQRGQERLLAAGIDISSSRARKVVIEDFDRFDLIIAMDKQNLAALKRLSEPGQSHKIHLFLDFAPHLAGQEVPDPYYGHSDGFDHVFELISAAGSGLADHIQSNS